MISAWPCCVPAPIAAHRALVRPPLHRRLRAADWCIPARANLSRFIRAGYLIEAPDLRTLAERIGADPDGLAATVAAHNADAQAGVDRAFGRGESDLNRINGDPANTPNPCLRPIGPGPFYAVAVRPADLASSAGLVGDADGRVLDAACEPIPGLYACGNDLASIFRGTYPGPGTTIGPALVFGWRAARHAAGLSGGPDPRTTGGTRMTAFKTAIDGHGAIVTGGARGFGLAIARRLAAAGCRVVLWDRSFDAFDPAAAGFDPVLRQVVDVTDAAAVSAAFAQAAAALGQVHILVNNAGITGPVGPSWEYALEDWRRVLAIDLDGVFHGCRAAIPHMRDTRLRPHRQHRLHRRQGGQCQRRCLCRGQRRRDRVHQVGRQGARGQRRPGELPGAGNGANRVARRAGAGVHRRDEGQDPDGPFSPGRRGCRNGRLGGEPGVQLHDRICL